MSDSEKRAYLIACGWVQRYETVPGGWREWWYSDRARWGRTERASLFGAFLSMVLRNVGAGI